MVIQSNIPGISTTNSLNDLSDDVASSLSPLASSIIKSGVNGESTLGELSSLVPAIPSIQTLRSLSSSIINSGVDPGSQLSDIINSDSPFRSIAQAIVKTGVGETTTLGKLFSLSSSSSNESNQAFDSLAASVSGTWWRRRR